MRKLIGICIVTLLIGTAFPALGFEENNEKNILKNIASENCKIKFYEMKEDISSIEIFDSKNINTVMIDQVDQQQTINTGSERIQDLSKGLAQSFKPTAPILSKIGIFLTKSTGTPEFANYYIEIRSDIHSSTYLKKITLSGSDYASYSLFWLTIDFADITVIPGNNYWIVCHADIPTIYSTEIKWCYGSPGDPYPNGNSMVNTIIGWQAYDLWGDFCFKTYKPDGSTNNPPNTPNTPSGPNSGNIGVSYSYSTSATDPDGDDIKYGWDWDGDNIVDEYSGFYTSGATCTISHSWSYPGIHTIKVKAKDENDALSGFSSALTVTITNANNPPNKPSTPSGPFSGKTGISYSYSTSVTDPDGDDLYYLFEWGDSQNSGWIGPYSSGSTVTEAHTWQTQGTFPIKVKAKDTSDEESVWSDPLSITMPKNKFSNIYQLILWRFIEKYSLLEPLLYN